MKTGISNARMRALSLAVCAAAGAFSVAAQTPPSQVVTVLPETVVTASRFKENADSLPYGVSVITADDIRRSGVISVNQALMRLLGVQGRVDFYGGGDYGLDLRGFGSTADNNQVYVLDGIRISEADTGGTRLAGIGIESIERIEVIHGSGAVMYGAGATGGVVLITTKAGRGQQRKNSADLYAGFGSSGLRDQRAGATLNSGEFTLDVGANALQTNNHRDYFKSDQVSRAMTGQWSRDWLRAGVRYSDDKLTSGLPGSLTAVQFEANPTQTDIAYAKDVAVIANERQSVFAEVFWNDWQFGIDTGERSKRLDTKGSSPFQYVIDAQTTNLRARNETTWGKVQNAFTVGYDLAEWSRKKTSSSARQLSDGVYLQNDLSLPSGLRLSGGVRAEVSQLKDTKSRTDSSDSLRAWDMGFSQKLAAGFVGFGRIGTSFRLPNVDDVGYVQPSTVLQPQSSRDLEAGLRWSGDIGRTELRFYRNALNNELAYDATVGAFGANVNLDPTLRQGLEIQSKYIVSKTLETVLNASWRQSKFSEGAHAGQDIPLAPKGTLAATAIWQPVAGHSVNAGVNWVSSQSVDVDNQCSISPYATYSAGYAYLVRNMEFSFGVTNLTDLKYYTYAFDCTAGVTNGIYPEAGRAWKAAARFVF